MKKIILSSALVTGLIISGGIGTSALASIEDSEPRNQVIVVDSNDDTIEPEALPAVALAGRAATAAWKAIPSSQRMLVTQGLQSMIGLGGVQQSNEPTVDEKELEYLFDK